MYVIWWDVVALDHDLSYKEELIAILDKQTRKLRSKHIDSMKVHYRHHYFEEATWEVESDI